ncbi:MAG: histidine kinase [Planctomycetota bacterium]
MTSIEDAVTPAPTGPDARRANVARRWALLAFAWTLPGALQLVQEATYGRAYGLEGLAHWRALPLYLTAWLPWIPLTAVVVRATRRLSPRRIGWARSALGHAALATAAGGLHLVAVGWIRMSFPPDHWPPAWVPASMGAWLKQSFWSFQLQAEFLAYLLVVAATLAFDHDRGVQAERARALELEARLHQAQLSALRNQLRPHFLFNALNSAVVLAEQDGAAAATMLRRISTLLRTSLEREGEESVCLADELELARHYLGIESVRFADRLSTSFAVDPDALDLEVPAWILQPLVENAVRHGVAPLARRGHVRVGAALEGDELRLTVEDDGVGVAGANGGSAAGVGLGLRGTRERLRAAFGERGRLDVEALDAGGTRVSVALPAVERAAGTERDA